MKRLGIPNADYHTEKAAEHFGIKPEEVTKEQRKFAKHFYAGEAYGVHGQMTDFIYGNKPLTPEQLREKRTREGKLDVRTIPYGLVEQDLSAIIFGKKPEEAKDDVGNFSKQGESFGSLEQRLNATILDKKDNESEDE